MPDHDTGRARYSRILASFSEPFELGPCLVTLVVVATATAVAWLLRPVAGLENVDLVLLTAIIAVAVRYGWWPSLVGSVTSVLAYNFFFLPPLYTFAVAEPTNVAALFFFLLVAGTTSHLAARVRAEALFARKHARATEALYAFSRRIAGLVTVDELARATTEQIASMLRLDAVLLLPDKQGALQLWADAPTADALDGVDIAAVRAAWSDKALQQRDRDMLCVGERMFIPMWTSRGLVGIIGLSGGRHNADPSGPSSPFEASHLLHALIDQAAVALERVRLSIERDEARLAAETERLRSALLTSLSHDLKTPLASITGAVTALREYSDLYDATARDELVSTIKDEADRLGRYVANLLDMMRLESGGVALNPQPVEVGEVVGTALERLAPMLAQHRIVLDLDPILPMLALDVILFEQALVNILDNAAKYAPAGTTVTIEGRCQGPGVLVRILDEGPGLPPEAIDRVFEKFYRAERGEQRPVGTGLGLAISRGFIEALGGTLQAANRQDRPGAVFKMSFPEVTFAIRREETGE